MSVRVGQPAPGLDPALRVYDRTKDATDKLCPCNWKPGPSTLN